MSLLRTKFFYGICGCIFPLSLILILPLTSSVQASFLAEDFKPKESMALGPRCPAPVLLFPSHEAYWPRSPIQLTWQPVTGCTFSGYEVCLFTMSPLSTDHLLGDECTSTPLSTNTHHVLFTVPSKYFNEDIYWRVRAANAPDGAQWSNAISFVIAPSLPFYQVFLPVTQRGRN